MRCKTPVYSEPFYVLSLLFFFVVNSLQMSTCSLGCLRTAALHSFFFSSFLPLSPSYRTHSPLPHRPVCL